MPLEKYVIDQMAQDMTGQDMRLLDPGGRFSICHKRFDHANDDGAVHRKGMTANGTGIFIYEWAIRNNYPPIFKVLCWNHNFKKHLRKLRRKV